MSALTAERLPTPTPHARFDSFVACIRAYAEAQPNALALYELKDLRTVTSPLTFADLDRKARAVAANLQRLGATGQRVLLVLDYDLHYIVAFLACGYARCVAVNLLPPTKPKHLERVAHVARDCDATRVLISSRIASRIQKQIDGVPELRALTYIQVDQIADQDADNYDVMTPDPHDLCYLQYTSGSTGSPRGVMVSHSNLTAVCATMQPMYKLGPGDHAINWMPLYHDLGLIIGHLLPLYCGIPSGLSDPLSFIKHPLRWLKAISDQRATFAGGPNFAFDLCLDAVDPAELEGIDLSCWKGAYNGAEPVRGRTIERFIETFSRHGFQATAMAPTYGLAEYTLVVTTKPMGSLSVMRELDANAFSRDEVRPALPGERSVQVVSCGRPGEGTTLKIVDQTTGQALEDGRVGEIWVSGPSIAQGYWNREEDSARIFRARLPGDPRPWLRTGDLGFIVDDELFITGRSKDVIIVFGANHYPQDIEETVQLSHDAIRPHFVAVFADDREDREALVIVAELRRDAPAQLELELMAEQIFRAIARKHEIQADEVHFVHHGQVPKTTSGKIQRSLCRTLLREGRFETYGSCYRGGAQ